jgi:hypothetical protein
MCGRVIVKRKKKRKIKSGHESQREAPYQDELVDWLSAARRTPTPTHFVIQKYGREFCGTSTQEWLLWQGPEAIVQVNYRPVLSSERALQSYKNATVWRKFQGESKIGRGSQMSTWHQDWLADWLSVVMWLRLRLSVPVVSCNSCGVNKVMYQINVKNY